MSLLWRPAVPSGRDVVAYGARGEYRVRQHGAGWLLTGIGHDRLPMLALPPMGSVFDTDREAKHAALKIDVAIPAGEWSGV